MDLDDLFSYEDSGEYRLARLLKQEVAERRKEAAELRRLLAAAEEREARLAQRLRQLERRLPGVFRMLSDLVEIQTKATADPGPALARALIRRAVPALTGADPIPGATAAWPRDAADFLRMAERLPDVDDWSLAAARGVAALLLGDEEGGLRHVAEARAVERAGTGCFLTLAFVAADRADDAARWLPLALADLTWQSVPQPSQRAVWELAASGAAGAAGVREVVAWLTEVVTFAQRPTTGAVMEKDWVGLGVVPRVAAEGAESSAPDVLAVGEDAARVPIEAAERLAGLYEMCRSAALRDGVERPRETAAAALMALLKGADTARLQATEEMRRAVETALVFDDDGTSAGERRGGPAEVDLGVGDRPGWARATAAESRPRDPLAATPVLLPVVELLRADLFGTAPGQRRCGLVALRVAAPVIASYAEELRRRVDGTPPLDVHVDLGRGVTLTAVDENDPAVGEALARFDAAVDTELGYRPGLFGRRPSSDAAQQPKKRARARVSRAFAVRAAYVDALAAARNRAEDHYRTLLDLLGRVAEGVEGD